MARGRVAELMAVTALAAIIVAVMASPVLRAPSDRVFGMEMVGRHHDPFTVMEQFGRPIRIGAHAQPVTDVTGALLARLIGAVAAYNLLVLISFPLSAAAAYLLARHLALSAPGAALAAMAYAFAPFHVAHAAYHIHVAQTQWLPLYLLALWRCLDRASPTAIAWLGAATAAVTLSNFYGGFVAAVVTPVAVALYWLVGARAAPGGIRRLAVTGVALVLLAAAGLVYARYAGHDLFGDSAAFAVPRADLFRYSAKWWSYLVPPVAHPILGDAARQVWMGARVGDGLLEHQVSLGWGIVALGLVGIGGALTAWSRAAPGRIHRPLAVIPIVAAIALTALVCSLSPERTIGGFTMVRPSAWLYDALPMFRGYARFAVVVQLMAALLAGFGFDFLRRTPAGWTRATAAALVALAAAEYAVWPPSMWRDVLPTSAHRWVTQQAGPLRVLDCVPLTPESASMQWLTGQRITPFSGVVDDCLEPDLARKLAAAAFTHLLVRRDGVQGRRLSGRPLPDGLRPVADRLDGRVFAVVVPPPAVYTASMRGFFPREFDDATTWRWMRSGDASWTVVNPGARPLVATLSVELFAFHRPREVAVTIDGQPVRTLVVGPHRATFEVGPLSVSPGSHQLVFQPVEPATPVRAVVAAGDPRALSIALGSWAWRAREERP
jgi:hypothetical protein